MRGQHHGYAGDGEEVRDLGPQGWNCGEHEVQDGVENTLVADLGLGGRGGHTGGHTPGRLVKEWYREGSIICTCEYQVV